MGSDARCKNCGAELTSEASPDGHCPGCLLKFALATAESGDDPEEQNSSELARTQTAAEPDADLSIRIGPYRILQKLGEGGMGEVYLAEQSEPVRRRVALKLIKPGMDSKQVIARFESERQALALMAHPAIATVLDAGTTDRGRPYFAMEYVEGEPITVYCDRLRLGTTDRLNLFMRVCEGVQHAHQKGVIHRDLKPSNVLVKVEDRTPVPKIIDFGVAKATQQRLTERSVFTQLGVLIGTPEYMSPEQAEMTTLDVDTRTDVYSLGVLLYELLAGALPFDPGDLRRAGFDELRRRIREEEPSKPSTRISSLEQAKATHAASQRGMDLASLTRVLQGDLDWITMRALEKDRTRRYQSPAELRSEIERHLNHLPVIAGPPGVVYRARKFVRRHRVGVAGSLTLLVAIAAVGLVLGFGLQARSRWRQEEARRMVMEARLDLEGGLYREGLRKIDQVLRSDPQSSRARVLRAQLLIELGRSAEAARDARDLIEENAGDWTAHLILARAGLPGTPVEEHVRFVEANAPATADAYFLRSMLADSVRDRLETLDRAIDLDAGHAEALQARIGCHIRLKDLEAAILDCERLIAVRPRSATGRRMLVRTRLSLNRFDDGWQTLEKADKLDPDDPLNAQMEARILGVWGRYEEALASIGRAIELAPENPDFLNDRADIHRRAKRYDLAEADARSALEIDPDYRWAYGTLFRSLLSADRMDELRAALDLLRERAVSWHGGRARAWTAALTSPQLTRDYASWHDSIARSWAFREIAEHTRLLGDYEEALADADQAIAADPKDFWNYIVRARVHRKLEDREAAQVDCDLAAEISLEEPGSLRDRSRRLWYECGLRDLALADIDRAIELAPRWDRGYRARSYFHWAAEEHEKAFFDLERAIELNPLDADNIWTRAQLYTDTGRFDEALQDYEHFFQLAESHARNRGLRPGRSYAGNVRRDYAELLSRMGREEQALAVIDESIRLVPRDEVNHQDRAILLFRSGRAKESIESLHRAIQLAPKNARSYMLRAEFGLFVGRTCDELREDMSLAQELGRNDDAIRNSAIWLEASRIYKVCPDLYDEQATLASARTAVKSSPRNASSHLTLGVALLRSREYEDASVELQRALELDPNTTPIVLFALSSTSWHLGDRTAAHTYYDRGVDRMRATHPQDPQLEEFRQEAAALLVERKR
jgi:serine/threonine protein kinase/Flp pilus assembly protein TadD